MKNSFNTKYLHPFGFWGRKIIRANGVFLYDEDDKEYIDFTSSGNVVNIGYNHPRMKAIMSNQIEKLIFAPPWCKTIESESLVEQLSKIFPDELDSILRSTTGSESVEIAMKLARWYTKKSRFMSFKHSWHGHTFGVLSIGNTEKVRDGFKPLLTDSTIIDHPYLVKSSQGFDNDCENTLKQIESEFRSGIYAAFVTEGFVSCPGCLPLSNSFFVKLRKLCDVYNVALIFDEVGTGFGRTGKMFSYERSGIIPDIVCVAKGLGSGYSPIAAVITRKEISKDFIYFATYAWTPFACAVASENIRIIVEENLSVNSEKLGAYALEKLRTSLKDSLLVKDIRGLGLEMAIELRDEESYIKIIDTCLSKGLFLLGADLPFTFLIMPPLSITKDILDKGLEIIIDSINELTNI
ncbi:MAG: aspartate aminotransferase family protein [Candidatus Taylorbacteria bacterium]